MNDYAGKTWFWHRFVWKIPSFIFKSLEFLYIIFASFFYSPKNAFNTLRAKLHFRKAQTKLPASNEIKVGSCFNDQEVKVLANLIRQYYSSCLWKKGDILLVDNRQVVHAGMPGSGPRLIRALVCNPIEMRYSLQPGYLLCEERTTEAIGFYLATGKLPKP